MAIAITYFAYLFGMALVSRAPAARRLKVAVVSAATLSTIWLIGMRHIMPLMYLLIGYWLPALLVREHNPSLERRLLAFDYTLFGADGLDTFVRRGPRLLVEYLELAYLLCYAVVPAAALTLSVRGFGARADLFWSIVLLASFACYGLLPWMPTRAPRALEPRPLPSRSAIRKWNLVVLDRGSVQWNTFPSGHTAASLAAALALGVEMPWVGGLFAVVAISIAAGSVAGRYHYAADAITGALVAIAAFITATAALAP